MMYFGIVKNVYLALDKPRIEILESVDSERSVVVVDDPLDQTTIMYLLECAWSSKGDVLKHKGFVYELGKIITHIKEKYPEEHL